MPRDAAARAVQGRTRWISAYRSTKRTRSIFADTLSRNCYSTNCQEMARPADPEKRLELARKAVEILSTSGLDMPMSQLADALGVKRPTLLYHFPSRGHIV